MPLKQVDTYIDGSSLGNPGKAGIGIVLKYGEHVKEISRGFEHMTNNQAELSAAIIALEALNESCNVNLYSDSEYVVKGIERLPTWIAKGWKGANNKPIANKEYWQRLYKSLERHAVTPIHVKGHNGNPLNVRADTLAYTAASSV